MSADLIRYSSLDLRHLRLMLAVSESSNLTSAARRLHLTTSALSHQLRHLEDLANRPIFHRDGKSMRPTRAGEMLIQTARRVLEVVYDAEEQLRDGRDLDTEIIRMCTHCYTGYHWLPAVLRAFQQTHRDVEVRIVPEETRQPFDALREKRLDLVLTFDPPPDAGVTNQLLFRDELLLLLSKHHRLAKQRHVPLRELKDEHLILYSPKLDDTFFYREHLLPQNIRPKRFSGIVLTEAILEMVRANMGVTVLAKWATRCVRRDGVVAKQIPPHGIRRNWYAVTRERPVRGSAMAALIDRLREDMGRFARPA